jgi:hypothetical protein
MKAEHYATANPYHDIDQYQQHNYGYRSKWQLTDSRSLLMISLCLGRPSLDEASPHYLSLISALHVCQSLVLV